MYVSYIHYIYILGMHVVLMLNRFYTCTRMSQSRIYNHNYKKIIVLNIPV